MALDKTTVTGLREASAVFRKLPEVSQDAFNAAVLETVQIIALRASAKAPVGRTGALKRAIGYSMNARTGQGKVGVRLGFEVAQVGRSGSALTSKGAFLHRPTKIGHLVEFGHGGPHAASAHPFMMTVVDREQGGFLDRCRRAGKQIERDMSTLGGNLL